MTVAWYFKPVKITAKLQGVLNLDIIFCLQMQNMKLSIQINILFLVFHRNFAQTITVNSKFVTVLKASWQK